MGRGGSAVEEPEPRLWSPGQGVAAPGRTRHRTVQPDSPEAPRGRGVSIGCLGSPLSTPARDQASPAVRACSLTSGGAMTHSVSKHCVSKRGPRRFLEWGTPAPSSHSGCLCLSPFLCHAPCLLFREPPPGPEPAPSFQAEAGGGMRRGPLVDTPLRRPLRPRTCCP